MSKIYDSLRYEGISWRAAQRLTDATFRGVVDAATTPAPERSSAQQRTIVNVQALEAKRKRRIQGANTAVGRVNGGYLSNGQPRGHGKH